MDKNDKFVQSNRGPLGKLYESFRVKILNIYKKYF